MNKLLRQAFTLIELLVVIAIIGILSGLIVVSMSGVTNKANIAKGQVFANSLRNALMADMISEWKFDGGTVGNSAVAADILDSWDGNNAVTVLTSPGPIIKGGTDCVSGNCLSFDGTDDSVDFGNKSDFSMGIKNHTVSVWVKFNNTVSGAGNETLFICGANADTSAGYFAYRPGGGSNRIFFYFSDGVTRNGGYLTTAGAFAANTWYNIVVTMNRLGSAQAYVNGQAQTGNSVTISSQSGSISNAANLRIGVLLSGSIDEMRIFNSIPSISQIKEQYYAGLNKMLNSGMISKEEYISKINSLSLNTK